MAAGSVSGTVALMLHDARMSFGAKPTPNTIKAMLMQSAFPMSDATGRPYDALTQGAGALNTVGAVALAQAIDPRMGAGSSWLVASPAESSAIDGQTISWGQNIVWGDNVVWGDALYTNRTSWATNIVWGDSYDVCGTGGQNIVWGSLAGADGWVASISVLTTTR